MYAFHVQALMSYIIRTGPPYVFIVHLSSQSQKVSLTQGSEINKVDSESIRPSKFVQVNNISHNKLQSSIQFT